MISFLKKVHVIIKGSDEKKNICRIYVMQISTSSFNNNVLFPLTIGFSFHFLLIYLLTSLFYGAIG